MRPIITPYASRHRTPAGKHGAWYRLSGIHRRCRLNIRRNQWPMGCVDNPIGCVDNKNRSEAID